MLQKTLKMQLLGYFFSFYHDSKGTKLIMTGAHSYFQQAFAASLWWANSNAMVMHMLPVLKIQVSYIPFRTEYSNEITICFALL